MGLSISDSFFDFAALAKYDPDAAIVIAEQHPHLPRHEGVTPQLAQVVGHLKAAVLLLERFGREAESEREAADNDLRLSIHAHRRYAEAKELAREVRQSITDSLLVKLQDASDAYLDARED